MSKLAARSGSGNAMFLGGGYGAGKGLVIPRYGLLNGMNVEIGGLGFTGLRFTCTLNGLVSTKRLL